MDQTLADSRCLTSVRLDEAEVALTHARQHGRAHLVAAHTGGQQLSRPSPDQAQAELDLRADQARHADEVLEALDEEIGRGCADNRPQ